ncbi:unnamed protein product, partial [Urochloa humidicola]
HSHGNSCKKWGKQEQQKVDLFNQLTNRNGRTVQLQHQASAISA